MIFDLSGSASARIGDHERVRTQMLEPIWINDEINLPTIDIETLKRIYLLAHTVFGSSICEKLLTNILLTN